MLFIFQILTVTALMLLPATAAAYGANSDSPSEWSVEQAVEDRISYIVEGKKERANQFGFHLQSKNCTKNILWLAWRIPINDNPGITEKPLELEFLFDHVRYLDSMNFMKTSPIPTFELLLITNIPLKEDFMKDTSKSKSLQITITGPAEVTKLLDVKTDTFNLKGFKEAKSSAVSKCRRIKAADLGPEVM